MASPTSHQDPGPGPPLLSVHSPGVSDVEPSSSHPRVMVPNLRVTVSPAAHASQEPESRPSEAAPTSPSAVMNPLQKSSKLEIIKLQLVQRRVRDLMTDLAAVRVRVAKLGEKEPQKEIQKEPQSSQKEVCNKELVNANSSNANNLTTKPNDTDNATNKNETEGNDTRSGTRASAENLPESSKKSAESENLDGGTEKKHAANVSLPSTDVWGGNVATPTHAEGSITNVAGITKKDHCLEKTQSLIKELSSPPEQFAFSLRKRKLVQQQWQIEDARRHGRSEKMRRARAGEGEAGVGDECGSEEDKLDDDAEEAQSTEENAKPLVSVPETVVNNRTVTKDANSDFDEGTTVVRVERRGFRGVVVKPRENTLKPSGRSQTLLGAKEEAKTGDPKSATNDGGAADNSKTRNVNNFHCPSETEGEKPFETKKQRTKTASIQPARCIAAGHAGALMLAGTATQLPSKGDSDKRDDVDIHSVEDGDDGNSIADNAASKTAPSALPKGAAKELEVIRKRRERAATKVRRAKEAHEKVAGTILELVEGSGSDGETKGRNDSHAAVESAKCSRANDHASAATPKSEGTRMSPSLEYSGLLLASPTEVAGKTSKKSQKISPRKRCKFRASHDAVSRLTQKKAQLDQKLSRREEGNAESNANTSSPKSGQLDQLQKKVEPKPRIQMPAVPKTRDYVSEVAARQKQMATKNVDGQKKGRTKESDILHDFVAGTTSSMRTGGSRDTDGAGTAIVDGSREARQSEALRTQKEPTKTPVPPSALDKPTRSQTKTKTATKNHPDQSYTKSTTPSSRKTVNITTNAKPELHRKTVILTSEKIRKSVHDLDTNQQTNPASSHKRKTVAISTSNTTTTTAKSNPKNATTNLKSTTRGAATAHATTQNAPTNGNGDASAGKPVVSNQCHVDEILRDIEEEEKEEVTASWIKETISQFIDAQERNFEEKEQVVVQLDNGETAIQFVNPAVQKFCKILRKLGLFCEYEDTKLHLLVKRMMFREVKKGDWIFRAGDSGADVKTGGFYSILAGKVAVWPGSAGNASSNKGGNSGKADAKTDPKSDSSNSVKADEKWDAKAENGTSVGKSETCVGGDGNGNDAEEKTGNADESEMVDDPSAGVAEQESSGTEQTSGHSVANEADHDDASPSENNTEKTVVNGDSYLEQDKSNTDDGQVEAETARQINEMNQTSDQSSDAQQSSQSETQQQQSPSQFDESSLGAPICFFQAGGKFGDQALVSRNPRSASIRAEEDCIFAVLQKSAYAWFLRNSQLEDVGEFETLMKTLPQFQGWDPATVQVFASFFKPIRTFPMQVAVSSSTYGKQIAYILKGQFEVLQECTFKGQYTILEAKGRLRCTYQKKGAITIGRLEKGDAFGDECVVHSEATKNILRRRKALSGKFSQQGGEGEEENADANENGATRENEEEGQHDDGMSPSGRGGSPGGRSGASKSGSSGDHTNRNDTSTNTTNSDENTQDKGNSLTDFPSDFPVVDVNAKPCLVSATAGHMMLIRDMDAFKRYITARHAYHFQPKYKILSAFQATQAFLSERQWARYKSAIYKELLREREGLRLGGGGGGNNNMTRNPNAIDGNSITNGTPNTVDLLVFGGSTRGSADYRVGNRPAWNRAGNRSRKGDGAAWDAGAEQEADRYDDTSESHTKSRNHADKNADSTAHKNTNETNPPTTSNAAAERRRAKDDRAWQMAARQRLSGRSRGTSAQPGKSGSHGGVSGLRRKADNTSFTDRPFFPSIRMCEGNDGGSDEDAVTADGGADKGEKKEIKSGNARKSQPAGEEAHEIRLDQHAKTLVLKNHHYAGLLDSNDFRGRHTSGLVLDGLNRLAQKKRAQQQQSNARGANTQSGSASNSAHTGNTKNSSGGSANPGGASTSSGNTCNNAGNAKTEDSAGGWVRVHREVKKQELLLASSQENSLTVADKRHERSAPEKRLRLGPEKGEVSKKGVGIAPIGSQKFKAGTNDSLPGASNGTSFAENNASKPRMIDKLLSERPAGENRNRTRHSILQSSRRLWSGVREVGIQNNIIDLKRGDLSSSGRTTNEVGSDTKVKAARPGDAKAGNLSGVEGEQKSSESQHANTKEKDAEEPKEKVEDNKQGEKDAVKEKRGFYDGEKVVFHGGEEGGFYKDSTLVCEQWSWEPYRKRERTAGVKK